MVDPRHLARIFMSKSGHTQCIKAVTNIYQIGRRETNKKTLFFAD